ncbi:MAG: zinc-ribbon domain-containing protein [Clostridia bacterium]|nr:zinc-ribbon domain-containing protein [Clostridia bacterium]
MKCPKCGKELQENARFCLYCMTSLDEKTAVPGPAPRRRLLPAILAAAGVLILGAALFFWLRGGSPDSPETEGSPITGTVGAASSAKTADPVMTAPDPTGETPPASAKPTNTTKAPTTTTKAPTTTTKAPTTTTKAGGGGAAHVHTTVTDPAVAPTCTTAGKTAGSHCATCGQVITAQTTVPATGHTAVTDPAVAATCTTAGKTEGSHCAVCGAVLTAQTTVQQKAHQYSEATYSAPAACIWCGATKGEPLPAPPISVDINSGIGYPRKASYNGNLRIESKPTVETVYNGDGTYTVKVTVTVTNLASFSIVGGIPAKIGYLSSREADSGWGGELKPGETGTKGAVFYNVPGGGTFGGNYYVTV